MVHHVVVTVVDTAAVRACLYGIIDRLRSRMESQYIHRPFGVAAGNAGFFVCNVDLFCVEGAGVLCGAAVETAERGAFGGAGFFKEPGVSHGRNTERRLVSQP